MTFDRSRFALGLAALGRPGYINLGHGDDLPATDVDTMRDHAHAMMDTAWDAGIRHFDAARSYGRAEDFLGSWLKSRTIPPDSVAVSSKWGYEYTANWQVTVDGPHEIKEHSLPMLQKQWGETRSHIGGWLDLYQIHSATLQTGVLENTTVLGELARLKHDHGVAVGLSLSGTEQAKTLDKAMTVEVDGVPLFSSVQATFNLLERSAASTLKAAHESGYTVIVKEAVANGRLTPANTGAAFADQMVILQSQAERLETSVDALALAYVLAQPWADVVLIGAARSDHLMSNLKALQITWDDEAEATLSALAEEPNQYWSTRSNLAWN